MVRAVWHNGHLQTSKKVRPAAHADPETKPDPEVKPDPEASLTRLRSQVQFPDLRPVLIRIQLRFPSQNRSLGLVRLRSQVTCRVSPRGLSMAMLSPNCPLPVIRPLFRLMPLVPLDWQLSLRPLLTACASVAEASMGV